MKSIRIMLIIFVAILPLLAELSVKDIEKMVKDIKSKRIGRIKDYKMTDSPFLVMKKDLNSSSDISISVPKQKEKFSLSAIVNLSAFIDDSWHKKGDMLSDFKIDTIAEDHVVLKKKNRTITLFFKKRKNTIKIDKE